MLAKVKFNEIDPAMEAGCRFLCLWEGGAMMWCHESTALPESVTPLSKDDEMDFLSKATKYELDIKLHNAAFEALRRGNDHESQIWD